MVGHSLECDLQALRLVHTRVLDTSLVYAHPAGLPYRHALRHLRYNGTMVKRYKNAT